MRIEVCTKTGAIASIIWDRDDEGKRDSLSAGSAARRRHTIHYLFVEVFGDPKRHQKQNGLFMGFPGTFTS